VARLQRPNPNPRKPRSTERPLRYSDLTAAEQDTASRQFRDAGDNLADRLRSAAGTLAKNPKAQSKVRRLHAAAGEVLPGRTSIGQAAQNRVDYIERSTRGDLRMEGEAVVPGAAWYFGAAREEAPLAPNHTPRQAFTAASIMSPNTKPATERRALEALAAANETGYVQGDLFSDIPGSDVVGLIKTRPESTGVAWTALAGPNAPNVGRAHDVMRGAADPRAAQPLASAPKTVAYTEDKILAGEAAGTEVEGEYRRRAGIVGDKIKGTVGVGQTSLDLYGLAGSTEGILDPQAVTAEDSWMEAINVSHKLPQGRGLVKAVGDAPHGRTKVYKNRRARRHGDRDERIAYGDPSVSGESIRYAASHAATVEAGALLGEKYELAHPDDPGGFAVPSVFTQETAWTGIKRSEPDRLFGDPTSSSSDSAFSSQRRARNQPPSLARGRRFPGSTKWGR
jgi:hypothetical protein